MPIVMINEVKKIFYFPIAYYFRFFAKIQLGIWKPLVIVVTGSSGKTILLNLIESQLQDKAKYSHFANSAYGIPFNILGLSRKKLTLDEWVYLFVLAPFKAFKKAPLEKIYVVEADCDRPFEGKFLASLLKPSLTLWLNISRTHSKNFDYLVKCNKFSSVDKAIVHEFGYFLEYTLNLAIVNGDSDLITKQTTRTKASIGYITQKSLNSYKVFKDSTEFIINSREYTVSLLLPKETFYSIQMTLALLEYLKIKPDYSFSKFKLSLTPGRCSLLKGIKNTTIIDSSYNATPDGVRSMLQMFKLYPADKKWLVLGDMIELGNEEQEEHEKLVDIINSMKLNSIILVGPRLSKYTYPKVKEAVILTTERRKDLLTKSENVGDFSQASPDRNDMIKTFLMPKDALDYLVQNLKGGEAILFKGARFLEGIIEHLLLDKNDVNKLVRRELIWQERRKKWGL